MSNEKFDFFVDLIDSVLEIAMSIVIVVAGIKYIFWG
jgi:hypothetical protein